MRNSYIIFGYTCPRCLHRVLIKAWPVIPAKVTGPPEQCYPEEGGEWEPEECDRCGSTFDPDHVTDAAAEEAQARAEAAAEARQEQREEDRRMGL
jgi:DNA-directed RNA polymerase subunit RPC12/RpoP